MANARFFYAVHAQILYAVHAQKFFLTLLQNETIATRHLFQSSHGSKMTCCYRATVVTNVVIK
jgi:hypothetical protein